MAGKTGAARVALLTKAPVIPVAQWGANDSRCRRTPRRTSSSCFPRKTLKVQAGPPVDLCRFYGQEPTPEVLREATEVIMAAITAPAGGGARREGARAEPYDHRKATCRTAAQGRRERDRK